MKLEISFNGETGMWQVSQENHTEVLWSGELRREGSVLLQEIERTAPGDSVERHRSAMTETGNVSFGYIISSR